jgi:NAD(P)-dependent dehydrogenase (short-subunit alcohol dehydrogenase family)
MDQKIAIVTGANRGIGLGTSKALAKLGYKVLMLGRKQDQLEKEAAAIRQYGGDAEAFEVDVSDGNSILKFGQLLKQKFSTVSCLVNNAGVFLDRGGPAGSAEVPTSEVDTKVIVDTFAINTLGPLRMAQVVIPLMKKARRGVIVNVSSGMGQLSEMGGYYAGYRVSKTALNAVTRILAAELADSNIKVNAICPGWVKTDMGGPNATRSLDEGVSGVVWAATLGDDGPTGGYFRDGRPMAW